MLHRRYIYEFLLIDFVIFADVTRDDQFNGVVVAVYFLKRLNPCLCRYVVPFPSVLVLPILMKFYTEINECSIRVGVYYI